MSAARNGHLRVVHPDNEPVELDDAYPESFLDCRDLRHSWRRLGTFHAYGEIVRVLLCSRCDTERRDHWSPNGFRLRSRYIHPNGYKLGGDVDQQAIRQQVLHRTNVFDSEAAMHAGLIGKDKKRVAK